MNTSTVLLSDGTYVDAIVGYRTWKMFGDHGAMFLSSVFQPVNWDDTDRVHKAECRCGKIFHYLNGNGNVDWSYNHIQGGHVCGIYAYSDLSQMTGGMSGHTDLARGEVLLWGDVHVHERGYRAEYAQISSLYTTSTMNRKTRIRVELAALTYDVPLVTLD